jgi:hypothetical protein
MSALENAVRVNSEKQTLILAGEPLPRQRHPLTIIATPVDEPMLLLQSGREEIGTELTALSRSLFSRSADRGNYYSAANAYARTQELSGGSLRSAIIDTYA